jgi:hypothetical protein
VLCGARFTVPAGDLSSDVTAQRKGRDKSLSDTMNPAPQCWEPILRELVADRESDQVGGAVQF